MDIYAPIQRVIKKEPLFTAIISELVPREDKSVSTIGTDGKNLVYNPEFMSKLSEDEQSGVVLHEALHCAFQHLWRRGKRNAFMFNMAADYAINGIVNENFSLPKGSLLDSKYYGMSAEQIYDTLEKTVKKSQGWCDKEDWGDSSGEKSEKKAKSFFDKLAKKLGVNEPPKLKVNSKQEEQRWKDIFDKHILKEYGQMPDSIKRVIEKEYYIPVIDWMSLVSNILSEDNTDYSFSSPDRRYLEDDFVLPDMLSSNRLKDIVFAYDTSGSINQHDLFAFYMETLNLFNNFSSFEGWVAICDAYLHAFKKINPQYSFTQFDFTGGGGTDFNPVFDEVAKEGLSPKALFYFTDTEGSFPQETPSYPVFWLVRSQIGDMYERQVPFGQVIKFMPGGAN